MHDKTYALIQDNPRFKELVSRRDRFAWLLSAIMLGLYVAFILLIAFEPQLLGTRIGAGPITWGIPLGMGLVALQGLSEIIKRVAWLMGRLHMDTHYERPLQ